MGARLAGFTVCTAASRERENQSPRGASTLAAAPASFTRPPAAP